MYGLFLSFLSITICVLGGTTSPPWQEATVGSVVLARATTTTGLSLNQCNTVVGNLISQWWWCLRLCHWSWTVKLESVVVSTEFELIPWVSSKEKNAQRINFSHIIQEIEHWIGNMLQWIVAVSLSSTCWRSWKRKKMISRQARNEGHPEGQRTSIGGQSSGPNRRNEAAAGRTHEMRVMIQTGGRTVNAKKKQSTMSR